MAGTTDVPVLKNKVRSKPISGQPFASLGCKERRLPKQLGSWCHPSCLRTIAPLRQIRLIDNVIAFGRPYLRADGGHCEHVHLDGDPVCVKHSGRLRGLPVQAHYHQRHAPEAQRVGPRRVILVN